MKLSLLCIADTVGHLIGLHRFGWFNTRVCDAFDRAYLNDKYGMRP